MARAARTPRSGPAPTEAEIDDALGTAPPAPGHNLPPQPVVAQPGLGLTAEQWVEWLDHVFEETARRRDELLASFERFKDGFAEITSDDVQGRAGDLRNKLRDLLKQAKNHHEREKMPVLTAQRAIDGYLKRFLAPIESAAATVQSRMDAYARKREEESRAAARADAERKRLEAEAATTHAAETLAPEDLKEAAAATETAEQATAFADARPAEHSRVHGPLGSVSSLTGTWKFVEEESDLMDLAKAVVAGKAPLAYLAFNTTRIGVAIRTERVREIAGCVIREERHVR